MLQKNDQLDLFSEIDRNKRIQAMPVIDQLNHRFGRSVLRFTEQPWKAEGKHTSNHHTAYWDELLEIHI